MLAKIIEKQLLLLNIPYYRFGERNRDSYDTHEVKFSLNDRGSLLVGASKEELSSSETLIEKEFSYHIKKKFDPKRKTVLYFHVNGGLDYSQLGNLAKDHNIVVFNFLGYGENHHKLLKARTNGYTIDHLLQQSTIILEGLEAVLKSPQYYGDKYQRQQNLILAGRSLGTIIATKLAASLEEKGERVERVINFVTPLNIRVAAKTLIGHHKFIILVLAAIIYILYIVYITKTLSKGKALSKQEIAVICSLTALLIIFPSFILIEFFWSAGKIGITHKDINKLKETPVFIVAPENDLFCDIKSLTSYFEPNKENFHICEILRSKHLPATEAEAQKQKTCQDQKTQGTFVIIETKAPGLTRMIIKDKSSDYNDLLCDPCSAHNSFELQDIALEQLASHKSNGKG